MNWYEALTPKIPKTFTEERPTIQKLILMMRVIKCPRLFPQDKTGIPWIYL